jgi:hypothetical protein
LDSKALPKNLCLIQYFNLGEKDMRTLLTLCLLIGTVLTGCGESDPQKKALKSGVNLMTDIVESKVLLDAVKNADPQMRASTAAGAALSGGVTANFRTPPEGIAILNGINATQPWSVILKGDDENKQVIIEGYGEDLQQPLISKEVDFPPR